MQFSRANTINRSKSLPSPYSWFAILLSAVPAHPQQPVELARSDDHIEERVGGKPFTTFYFKPTDPKPYRHPLRSAQGTIVTRGYPMVTTIPGEDRDHPHHRGLFFAHGDITGIDFWSEAQVEEESPVHVRGKNYSFEDLPTGRTVFNKLEDLKGGMGSRWRRWT